VGLFYKEKIVVSPLKHVTLKTSSSGISKMWSTIFSPSKLTEIIGILFRFKFIKTQQNCSNVNFKDTGNTEKSVKIRIFS